MDLDWNHLLTEQLALHWRAQLRPRLDGLTDEEYFWEPAADCWSIRPRALVRTPRYYGEGAYVYEFDPARRSGPGPITTIAWRIAHISMGCFGVRNAGLFGGPGSADHDTFCREYAFAGTAEQALAQLDAAYAHWIESVRALGQEGLARPCGPAEGRSAQDPFAALVLHIHREVLHHGAEIALLRDLHLHGTPHSPRSAASWR
jgi:hypothetical protein